jgi:hypothetical protein
MDCHGQSLRVNKRGRTRVKPISFIRRSISSSARVTFRRLGYEVRAINRNSVTPTTPPPVAPSKPYIEREEYGPSNIETKIELGTNGDVFEYPDILAVNRAVARLTPPARRVAELGGGTGAFATAAVLNPDVTVVCSELHVPTHEWAKANRPHARVEYLRRPLTKTDGPFDAVVAIELVEHIADYPRFLTECADLAPRALITTPNRRRNSQSDTWGPPQYVKHVREWTAGEFYWILRCFFDEVHLYGLTGCDESCLRQISVLDQCSQLVADCRRPRQS